MSHGQIMTVIGYGLTIAIFAPVIAGVVAILVAAIRERSHRTAPARPKPQSAPEKPLVRITPLHVVERSATGSVRVRLLPMRGASGNRRE